MRKTIPVEIRKKADEQIFRLLSPEHYKGVSLEMREEAVGLIRCALHLYSCGEITITQLSKTVEHPLWMFCENED